MNSIRRLERDGRDRSAPGAPQHQSSGPGTDPEAWNTVSRWWGWAAFTVDGRSAVPVIRCTAARGRGLCRLHALVRRFVFSARGAIGETRLRTCSAGSSWPTPAVQLQGAAAKLTLRHDHDTTCHVAHTVHRRKPTDALSSTSDTVGAASSQLVSKRTLDSLFARPALILSTLDLVRERQHRRRLDADIGLDPRG